MEYDAGASLHTGGYLNVWFALDAGTTIHTGGCNIIGLEHNARRNSIVEFGFDAGATFYNMSGIDHYIVSLKHDADTGFHTGLYSILGFDV